VLGADACKAGWIGIALSPEVLDAYAAAEIGNLVEDACSGSPPSVIPIGLPDTGRRPPGACALTQSRTCGVGEGRST